MGASWQAFYAHLCAASIIRAMPETEIPPAMRGDLYLVPEVGLVRRYWGSIAASPGNSKSIHWILFALRDVPFESRLSLINIKKRVRG